MVGTSLWPRSTGRHKEAPQQLDAQHSLISNGLKADILFIDVDSNIGVPQSL